MKKFKLSEFWKACLIRSIRTMAQTALTYLTGAVLLSDCNLLYLLSASLLSGVYSILTSIVTDLPEVQIVEPCSAPETTEDTEIDE